MKTPQDDSRKGLSAASKAHRASRPLQKRCKYNSISTGAWNRKRKVLAGEKQGYGTILARSIFPESLTLGLKAYAGIDDEK